MSGTRGPAAARSAAARVLTFFAIAVVAAATQLTGLLRVAHEVTSFPPMLTVMRPMCPRWAVRKASAAVACVVVG
jgi:hypothetical protein